MVGAIVRKILETHGYDAAATAAQKIAAVRFMSTATTKPAETKGPVLLTLPVMENMGYTLAPGVPTTENVTLLTMPGRSLMHPEGLSKDHPQLALLQDWGRPLEQTHLDAVLKFYEKVGITRVAYHQDLVGKNNRGVAGTNQELAAKAKMLLDQEPRAFAIATGQGPNAYFWKNLEKQGLKFSEKTVLCLATFSSCTKPFTRDPLDFYGGMAYVNEAHPRYSAFFKDGTALAEMAKYPLRYDAACLLHGLEPMVADRPLPEVIEAEIIGGNMGVFLANREEWLRVLGPRHVLVLEQFAVELHELKRQFLASAELAHKQGVEKIIFTSQIATRTDSTDPNLNPNDPPEVKKAAAQRLKNETKLALQDAAEEFYREHPGAKIVFLWADDVIGHGPKVNAPLGMAVKTALFLTSKGTYEGVVDASRHIDRKLVEAAMKATAPSEYLVGSHHLRAFPVDPKKVCDAIMGIRNPVTTQPSPKGPDVIKRVSPAHAQDAGCKVGL